MSPLVNSRNQASGQNLVESTKLERIITDSKTVHRKEKKEKKERRKHKKENREKSHKHSSKKEKCEKSHKHSSKKDVHVHSKQLFPSKKTSDEFDQLEKSDFTEELEWPQNLLGYLSDGSHNSKKRKRIDSPPAVESLIKAEPIAGKPLRIRLIFKKPKVDSPSLPREDFLGCSTSGGAESLNHKENAVQGVVTSSISCAKVCEPELNVPSTSQAAIAETKKRKKHKLSREDRYNALFDDWTPPSTICFSAMEVDSSSKDDDDWLFGNRTQERVNRKETVKIDEDGMRMHRSSDFSCPRAQFLSEVGIYSLPHTVPF